MKAFALGFVCATACLAVCSEGMEIHNHMGANKELTAKAEKAQKKLGEESNAWQELIDTIGESLKDLDGFTRRRSNAEDLGSSQQNKTRTADPAGKGKEKKPTHADHLPYDPTNLKKMKAEEADAYIDVLQGFIGRFQKHIAQANRTEEHSKKWFEDIEARAKKGRESPVVLKYAKKMREIQHKQYQNMVKLSKMGIDKLQTAIDELTAVKAAKHLPHEWSHITEGFSSFLGLARSLTQETGWVLSTPSTEELIWGPGGFDDLEKGGGKAEGEGEGTEAKDEEEGGEKKVRHGHKHKHPKREEEALAETDTETERRHGRHRGRHHKMRRGRHHRSREERDEDEDEDEAEDGEGEEEDEEENEDAVRKHKRHHHRKRKSIRRHRHPHRRHSHRGRREEEEGEDEDEE
uniref:Uncharacterized protein n=1 Tax=Chromera velia CCMP2878 TaxID=1169474 RepID=A0A0G4FM55_9ALVE|eukprot:Cvel_17652.t1-p1 / transcript=Cvel_17652.t1 / gene=Cvel_17652 / organism=Chromera_velia_CCMP2878 / gene_product=hypothetical protein / transcript_product=hypothetical protein / location=Cvel_scaffold1421:41225-45198(+) / protein_length=405 / sequence_SO=supercontig / SO=protein_coding / is_pseudo=false